MDLLSNSRKTFGLKTTPCTDNSQGSILLREPISNIGRFEGPHIKVFVLEKAAIWGGASWGSHSGGYSLEAHPVRNNTDGVLWCGKPDFSVKSLLHKVETNPKQGASRDTLVNSVWLSIAPPKVELMMWLALLGKLNTKALLCRKGIISPQEVNCKFCSTNVEDIHHLLVTCSVSWDIWLTLAVELGYDLTPQVTLRQHYENWISQGIRNRIRKKLWIATLSATWWSLWMQRNAMIFYHQPLDIVGLAHTIRWRLAFWSRT